MGVSTRMSVSIIQSFPPSNPDSQKKQVLTRLSSGKEGFIHEIIGAAIAQHEDIIRQIDGAIERNGDLIALLKEYSYKTDARPVSAQQQQWANQGNCQNQMNAQFQSGSGWPR